MTRKTKPLTESPEEVIETAILNLWHLRLVEQQAWLSTIPYRSVEEELLVRESHINLSEPARDLLGLVLNYPDEVQAVLNELPAPNSGYKRTGAHSGYVFNRGRVVTLARRRWDMTIREGQKVVDELVEFIRTVYLRK